MPASLLFVITRLPHAFSPPNFHARPLKRQASKAIADSRHCLARSRYFTLFLLRKVAVRRFETLFWCIIYLPDTSLFSFKSWRWLNVYLSLSRHTFTDNRISQSEKNHQVIRPMSASPHVRFLRGTRTKRDRGAWYRKIRGWLSADTAVKTDARTHTYRMVTGRSGEGEAYTSPLLTKSKIDRVEGWGRGQEGERKDRRMENWYEGKKRAGKQSAFSWKPTPRGPRIILGKDRFHSCHL